MAALGWILCGILVPACGVLGYLLWRSGAVEAQSAGRADQIEALQHKVTDLEKERADKWAQEAEKVRQDATKVTDLPSAIDFVRGVLARGKGPGSSSPTTL